MSLILFVNIISKVCSIAHRIYNFKLHALNFYNSVFLSVMFYESLTAKIQRHSDFTECRGAFQPGFAWLPKVSLLSRFICVPWTYRFGYLIWRSVRVLNVIINEVYSRFVISVKVKFKSLPLPVKMVIYLLTLKKICENYMVAILKPILKLVLIYSVMNCLIRHRQGHIQARMG